MQTRRQGEAFIAYCLLVTPHPPPARRVTPAWRTGSDRLDRATRFQRASGAFPSRGIWSEAPRTGPRDPRAAAVGVLQDNRAVVAERRTGRVGPGPGSPWRSSL